jgi:hypothetical protein
MKIGIYGDSYADPKQYYNTLTWVDIVREKHSGSCSFGMASSNLFYSLLEFKKYYKQFDKNIFLVTGPMRIWAPRFPIGAKKDQFLSSPSGVLNSIEFQKNNNNNAEKRHTNIKILESVLLYFAYIQNPTEDLHKQKLMIDEIKSLDPDVLLIPCFSISIPDVNVGLGDIFDKENAAWNYEFYTNDIRDVRNCHMTAENNAILANKVIDHVEERTAFDLNINHFVNPTLEDKDYYLHQRRKIN